MQNKEGKKKKRKKIRGERRKERRERRAEHRCFLMARANVSIITTRRFDLWPRSRFKGTCSSRFLANSREFESIFQTGYSEEAKARARPRDK